MHTAAALGLDADMHTAAAPGPDAGALLPTDWLLDSICFILAGSAGVPLLAATAPDIVAHRVVVPGIGIDGGIAIDADYPYFERC
jgi:hypothetical protein